MARVRGTVVSAAVSTEVHEELKHLADVHDTTVSRVISRMVQEGLAARRTREVGPSEPLRLAPREAARAQ